MSFPTALWCRSRRDGALCTRPRGHTGLHNRQGTSQMWSDVQADPAACPGGGSTAQPAPMLANGFPEGRALCPVCSDFVAVDDGTVEPHDTFRGAVDTAEAANRAEWFNTVGWN